MDRHDIPTALAIGFTITVFSTFGHEAIGHGVACILTGCDPVQFSSTYFIGNKAGLSASAIRTISLGGTLFNLVLGLGFLALLRTIGRGAPARRYYVLWFGAMVNLVSATGYLFFGSSFAFGDFRTILEGAGWPVRIGCILLGGVLFSGPCGWLRETQIRCWAAGRTAALVSSHSYCSPAIVASTILSASALLSPLPEAGIFSFIGHLFPAIGAWGMLQWFVGDGKAEPARTIARSRTSWSRGGPRCAGSSSGWTRSSAGDARGTRVTRRLVDPHGTTVRRRSVIRREGVQPHVPRGFCTR